MNFDGQLDFSILKDNIQHFLDGHPISIKQVIIVLSKDTEKNSASMLLLESDSPVFY